VSQWIAFAVVWTTHPNGQGSMLDAGIYADATPPRTSAAWPFAVGHARSSRGFGAASAKLLVMLQRCDLFDRMAAFPTFRRMVAARLH